MASKTTPRKSLSNGAGPQRAETTAVVELVSGDELDAVALTGVVRVPQWRPTRGRGCRGSAVVVGTGAEVPAEVVVTTVDCCHQTSPTNNITTTISAAMNIFRRLIDAYRCAWGSAGPRCAPSETISVPLYLPSTLFSPGSSDSILDTAPPETLSASKEEGGDLQSHGHIASTQPICPPLVA
jgi:hypothetical protein